MRRTRPAAWDRASAGHIAVALPRSVMNSRRFIVRIRPLLLTLGRAVCRDYQISITSNRPMEQKSRDHELFCSSATSPIAAKGKLLQTAPARAEQDDKYVVYYSASPRNKWR